MDWNTGHGNSSISKCGVTHLEMHLRGKTVDMSGTCIWLFEPLSGPLYIRKQPVFIYMYM